MIALGCPVCRSRLARVDGDVVKTSGHVSWGPLERGASVNVLGHGGWLDDFALGDLDRVELRCRCGATSRFRAATVRLEVAATRVGSVKARTVWGEKA